MNPPRPLAPPVQPGSRPREAVRFILNGIRKQHPEWEGTSSSPLRRYERILDSLASELAEDGGRAA